MRLSTKVLTGMSVAALSLALAGGIKAEAATFTAAKQMGGITSGDMVSYDAVKAKGESLVWNANAKWDTYYGTVSYVDITNVKTTKNAYITVKGTTDYTVYKITKDSVKAYKGTITAGALSITADKKEVATADFTNYQYRTEAGAWESLANTGLAMAPYEQQGATLYFRYKGAATVSSKDDSTAKVEGAPDGTKVSVIDADSFAGKEFKVKVPKMANAPAVSVDYNTGVAKAKNGTEYRCKDSFNDATSDWADFAANFDLISATGKVFQMRTKATEKKSASKIAVYNINKKTAPTVTTNSKAAEGTLITDALTFKSPEAASKDKATFEIKNVTTGDKAETYVIYKAKTVDGKKVADGKAIATLKPGKSVVLKDAKVKDETELLIQVAGDKKTGILPSALTANAKVLYNVKAS